MMSGSTDEDPTGESPKGVDGMISKITSMAGVAGKTLVLPMVKEYIQTQVINVLNENGPEQLEQYILVQYPLVDNDLPDRVKQGMQRVGPKYSAEIRQHVTPDNVLEWLDNPEEIIDADEETYEQIRECKRIIEETPRGRQWLRSQVLAVWILCGVADVEE